jgi:hypothetical protein
MQILGADVDALDELGRTFDQESRRLLGSVTVIDGTMRATWWSGVGATRFEADWHRTHAAAVRSVAQLLADASRALGTQSRQQRTASSGNDVAITAMFDASVVAVTDVAVGGTTPQSSSDRVRSDLQDLHDILDNGKSGSQAARETVSNAARALRTSDDPEVKSLASYILRNYGKDTQFVESPAFKMGSHGLVALGFILDAAKYSAEHKSVLEVVTRSTLDAGFSWGGAAAGGAAGAAACAELPIVGSVACGLAGAAIGGWAGNEVAHVVGDLAFDDYRVVEEEAPSGGGGGGGSW